VKTFSLENLAVGSHEITWEGNNDNGVNVASGVYLMRVKASSESKEIFNATKRVVLLK
jgi:flagellar hook assembly protein FlgD